MKKHTAFVCTKSYYQSKVTDLKNIPRARKLFGSFEKRTPLDLIKEREYYHKNVTGAVTNKKASNHGVNESPLLYISLLSRTTMDKTL